MKPSDITTLLEFCLSCTYFVFDGQFSQGCHVMGLFVSMIVCDAHNEGMEECVMDSEGVVCNVDDTHTNLDTIHAQFIDRLYNWTRISSSSLRVKRMVALPGKEREGMWSSVLHQMWRRRRQIGI